MMKKSVLAALLLTAVTAVCLADDRPIEAGMLPEAARTFIAAHFKGQEVAFAKRESEGYIHVEYDVFLTDGTKIVFGKEGEWKEIKNRTGSLPEPVIPKPISDYVKEHHPEARITGLERKRTGYEVKLSIHLEITFDRDFRVIEYDD